ncbi:MAG TPA: TIGR00730 family Rossman fold protein [Cryomorphaceae bacterium]|nr:TIGR00730 family Rossman fold protein [Cryomorphaceae bacterium]
MKSIAVFCGSSAGRLPKYAERAAQVGAFLAKNGCRVVYGGSHLGLMGAVAEGVLTNGGEVIGVLPKFMSSREIAHPELTELIMVESMHERKLKMHDLSDGVIALPGGFGTFEELFEMLTWAQLGLHTKPIGLLNLDGFYDHLIKMMDHMNTEGFLRPDFRRLVLANPEIDKLLGMMENFIPITKDDRIKPSQT